MMLELTSKQRAQLRSMCNTMSVVLVVGKDGITDGTIKEVEDLLEARELIKCTVQRGAPMSAREACQEICERVNAAPVQCIGNKFSIYRESHENPTIILL